jgi:hypothetical protein
MGYAKEYQPRTVHRHAKVLQKRPVAQSLFLQGTIVEEFNLTGNAQHGSYHSLVFVKTNLCLWILLQLVWKFLYGRGLEIKSGLVGKPEAQKTDSGLIVLHGSQRTNGVFIRKPDAILYIHFFQI